MSGVLLRTERLIVRRWTLDDVAEAFVIFSDPEVMRYVGDGTPERDPAGLAERYARRIAHYDDGTFRHFALEEKGTGRLLGNCGFSVMEAEGETEIAYHLRREAWGRGLATEVAGPFLELGHTRWGLHRIVAVTYPENHASRRVLEKIGMDFDGTARLWDKDLTAYSSLKPVLEERWSGEWLVPGPPAEVYRALVTGEPVGAWRGHPSDQPFAWEALTGPQGAPGRMWSARPGHRLRLAWGELPKTACLDLTLAERAGDTRMTARASGAEQFGGILGKSFWEEAFRRWGGRAARP